MRRPVGLISAMFAFKNIFLRDKISYEPPLRAELFSAHQMEQHGKNLAGAHSLSTGHAPDQLLTRLADNEHIIAETCALLMTAIKAN